MTPASTRRFTRLAAVWRETPGKERDLLDRKTARLREPLPENRLEVGLIRTRQRRCGLVRSLRPHLFSYVGFFLLGRLCEDDREGGGRGFDAHGEAVGPAAEDRGKPEARAFGGEAACERREGKHAREPFRFGSP